MKCDIPSCKNEATHDRKGFLFCDEHSLGMSEPIPAWLIELRRTRKPATTLGEDDFVFVDANFNPKFVHNVTPGGPTETWWLCYWHAPQRAWVTHRRITEQEREEFRRRSFSREHAELYFQ